MLVRRFVFSERCIPYTALSTGCRARRAFLIAFGVTARFALRTGCMARRTERGTNKREKKPTPRSVDDPAAQVKDHAPGLPNIDEAAGCPVRERRFHGHVAERFGVNADAACLIRP